MTTTTEIQSLHHTYDVEMTQLLIENGADVNARNVYGSTPLHLVSTIEIAKLLIKNGADINADNHGYTPLHTILSVEVGQLLIDNGADVNAIARYGRTPLHIIRNVKITKLLIKNGADINATDDFGQTPFQCIKERFDEERIMDIAYYLKNYLEQCEILKEKQNNMELQNELTNILLPFIKEKHLIPDILSMKFQMEFEEAT